MTENGKNELTLESCKIPIRISGKTYPLYATPSLSDTVAALADEAIRLSMLTENGKRSGVTAGFLSRAIDELIGEGAVDDIFGDTEPDLFGLCEILTFITESFGEYRKRRYRQMMEGRGEKL